jgi:hypothetical protein
VLSSQKIYFLGPYNQGFSSSAVRQAPSFLFSASMPRDPILDSLLASADALALDATSAMPPPPPIRPAVLLPRLEGGCGFVSPSS